MRKTLISLINNAFIAGARKKLACNEVGLSLRTYRRWTSKDGLTLGDKRPITDKAEPKNKLSQAERESILGVCNSAKYASLPPSQIVPTLFDVV
jgi:putative transposase